MVEDTSTGKTEGIAKDACTHLKALGGQGFQQRSLHVYVLFVHTELFQRHCNQPSTVWHSSRRVVDPFWTPNTVHHASLDFRAVAVLLRRFARSTPRQIDAPSPRRDQPTAISATC